MSSQFFLHAEENAENHHFIDLVKDFCDRTKQQAYLIHRPLGDNKYAYSYQDAAVLLVPKHKMLFVNFSSNVTAFQSYIDDFIEDLGSISDKYRYKDHIGRPRVWRNELVSELTTHSATGNIDEILSAIKIKSAENQRICELLISLLTGSINDIEAVKATVPVDILDKIKRKIVLFDGDQTRFVYQQPTKSPVRIQGLSGTGKTELLLHKVKDLYIASPDSRIAFTCHNRILADNLRRRIPEFFNFMKVEQQIKWNERLWCIHAWGSEANINSGTYRYICASYDLEFNRYSWSMSFQRACELALGELQKRSEIVPVFDYVLIDESQDFPEAFFLLCKAVTRHTVFIAGDTFQSIFDETITASIEPDYLLSKCYRTDPRTLMFAHSLGMGLFEKRKLRWLEDREWEACGYLVEKTDGGNTYRLKREPLRRFEDLDKADFDSVEIKTIKGDFYANAANQIISLISEIRQKNPTVVPDDIGIILLDAGNEIFKLADALEQVVPREIGWLVNKAHESKQKLKGQLFISNRNNVKGLEFPFVICVTRKIYESYGYRNSLYMTVSRSFLQTLLVVSEEMNAAILPQLAAGLAKINQNGYIEASPPSEPEKAAIKTTIKYTDKSKSFYDSAMEIFDEINVLPLFRNDLLETLKKVLGENFEYENAKEIAVFNYKKMIGD